jgi:hypothetical protein
VGSRGGLPAHPLGQGGIPDANMRLIIGLLSGLSTSDHPRPPAIPLSTAYCLLSTTYCLLSTVYCLLSSASCLLPTAYCLLPAVFPLAPPPASPTVQP